VLIAQAVSAVTWGADATPAAPSPQRGMHGWQCRRIAL